MFVRSLFLAACVATVPVLHGCASSGRKIDKATVEQIQPGKTSKDDMVALFGPPVGQGFDSNGRLTMSWMYVYVGPFGTGMKQQNLAVIFTPDGKVDKYNLIDSAGENGVRFGE